MFPDVLEQIGDDVQEDVESMIDCYNEEIEKLREYFKTNVSNEEKLSDLEHEDLHSSSNILLEKMETMRQNIDKYSEIDYSYTSSNSTFTFVTLEYFLTNASACAFDRIVLSADE